MSFTDIFIRRPVLASVISLLILALGLMAFKNLQLREFPKVDFASVNVSASLPGASAEVMQGFVSTPIQDVIASIEGIDYISTNTWTGGSSINVNLFPGTDADNVVAQIVSKIQQIQGTNLPAGMDNPTVQKGNPGADSILFLAFYSDQMTPEQISDYITRIVAPKIQAVPGVASASGMGSRSYAMRLWLDPRLMAAKDIQPLDVQTALTNNNVQSTAGSIQGNWNILNIQANTGLHSAEDFNNMIIKTNVNGSIVRMRDIGNAELGSNNYNVQVMANGKDGVILQVSTKTAANPLDVAAAVKKILPQILQQLPPTLHAQVVYDLSEFIKESINTVIHTLIEAAIIVILVILFCLGSFRAVLIPMVTIPVSLIGALAIMQLFGFSINILTLLALVLAIGLVVDDAIVVLENISRHLEEGLSPYDAAIIGAREIASPVITMTITLAAVFLPIGFAGGITGSLFTEFAFTLAGAVFLSGIVALTLSPMMCSRILTTEQLASPFLKWSDRLFVTISEHYQAALRQMLNLKIVIIIFAAMVLSSCFFLYITTQTELAPDEDQGIVFALAEGPINANFDYTKHYMQQIAKIYQDIPEQKISVIIAGQGGINRAESLIALKPREQRNASQMQVVNQINQASRQVAGVTNNAFNAPTLPGGDFGMPVNFVLTSAGSYQALFDTANQIVNEARNSGMFVNIENTLTLNNPTLQVQIDRDKAAQMGITPTQIDTALGLAYSGARQSRFDLNGRNYSVVPQVFDAFRLRPDQLNSMYVASTTLDLNGNAYMVPLANLITLKNAVMPASLPQFQRLNSATINGQMMPGYTMADGIQYLQKVSQKFVPLGIGNDLTGESRQFMQESNRMIIIFAFSLLVIFLVLSAQFESFRDPLIILISVPMSLFGALIPLNIGLGTINIFTQIGLLTLVGLISKHGILIVQFANKAQETEGLSVTEAVIRGATLRLRPILMTTAAMVLGVVPLLFASEGLANSQHGIALVIFCGMLIGTLFTLFVVPVFYTLIARRHVSVIPA